MPLLENNRPAPQLVQSSPVNLRHYPSAEEIIPAKSAEVLVGDAHGNGHNAAYKLHKHGFIQLPKKDYSRIYDIHEQSKKRLLKEAELWEIIRSFRESPTPDLETDFNAIGDLGGDRGGNDLITMLMLYILRSRKVRIVTFWGNHEQMALMHAANYFSRSECKGSCADLNWLDQEEGRYQFQSSRRAFETLSKMDENSEIYKMCKEAIKDFFKNLEFVQVEAVRVGNKKGLKAKSHTPFNPALYHQLFEEYDIEDGSFDEKCDRLNNEIKKEQAKFVDFDFSDRDLKEKVIEESRLTKALSIRTVDPGSFANVFELDDKPDFILSYHGHVSYKGTKFVNPDPSSKEIFSYQIESFGDRREPLELIFTSRADFTEPTTKKKIQFFSCNLDSSFLGRPDHDKGHDVYIDATPEELQQFISDHTAYHPVADNTLKEMQQAMANIKYAQQIYNKTYENNQKKRANEALDKFTVLAKEEPSMLREPWLQSALSQVKEEIDLSKKGRSWWAREFVERLDAKVAEVNAEAKAEAEEVAEVPSPVASSLLIKVIAVAVDTYVETIERGWKLFHGKRGIKKAEELKRQAQKLEGQGEANILNNLCNVWLRLWEIL